MTEKRDRGRQLAQGWSKRRMGKRYGKIQKAVVRGKDTAKNKRIPKVKRLTQRGTGTTRKSVWKQKFHPSLHLKKKVKKNTAQGKGGNAGGEGGSTHHLGGEGRRSGCEKRVLPTGVMW